MSEETNDLSKTTISASEAPSESMIGALRYVAILDDDNKPTGYHRDALTGEILTLGDEWDDGGDEPHDNEAPGVIQADEELCDAIAGALSKYSVAYSHVTLKDMSTAQREWKVHEVVGGNPFDRDEWLGVFDNKEEANAFCAKLRRNAALQITVRHRAAFASPAEPAPGAGSGVSFRAWLAFCIEQARYNHDAADPKAAEILTNVLERFDATPSLPAGREAIAREVFSEFIDAVEDGLTWNSSQTQCLDRINHLVKKARLAIAPTSAPGSGK